MTTTDQLGALSQAGTDARTPEGLTKTKPMGLTKTKPKAHARATSAMTRIGAAITAAVLLVGLLGLRDPAPAAAQACVNGWREVRTPDSAFLSTAFDIVTRKGKEAWIVGGSNKGVLALRWTGKAWKRTANGSRGHKGLVGAAAVGHRRVLGVGYSRPFVGDGNGSMQALSGRVVVNNWRGLTVPALPGPRATLTDVVALPKGRAMAVGTRLENGRLRATALIHNGRRWVRAEPWKGTGSGLLGVNRSAAGTTWAVGWKEAGLGRPRPYIVKRTGGRWRAVKPASLPAGPAVLTDVQFREGNNGYAVGYHTPTGSDDSRVVLMHWNGNRWRNVALPWAGDFAAMPRAIAVGPDGTIWIAGTKTANANREARGFIAHGRGQTWSVSTLSTPNDVRSEVMAVATTDKTAVAAATVGASLLVLKACGPNLPAASRTAAAERGVTRRQLKVSRMPERRASQRQQIEDVEEGHRPSLDIRLPGEGSGANAFSIAGDAARTFELASKPIKHPAFWVRNMASASGLAQWTKTYDGFAADFDGNGYPDVFYSRHGGTRPRLAMNMAGRFQNAPGGAFSAVDRHGCAAGDIDGDGFGDILCSVGASRGKATKRHELSLQPYRGARSLARDTLGISDPLGRGRVAAVFKLNDDRFREVFIGNAPDRDDGWPGYNRFYRNVGGRLRPAPGIGLDATHGANCAESGDFDGDGDQDLVYCTQYGFNGRNPGLRFMRNENGKLKDRTKGLGIGQIGDIDVAFADVTGDGRRDLIQLAPDRLRVSKWTGSRYRRIFEVKVTDAWAVAAGDASGDGRADIYVVRGNDKRNKPDRLLVSRGRGTRFASVKIPQASKGVADDVFALDYDRNGLVDFVVLNGRTKPGPVQLLASFPRR